MFLQQTLQMLWCFLLAFLLFLFVCLGYVCVCGGGGGGAHVMKTA